MDILIVDDESPNRALMKAYFNKVNEFGVLELTIVTDGTEAVEVCKNKRFDIVFMDVKMAKMNGVVATRLIKEILTDIFVVGVSSFISFEEIERYANEKPSFDRYLTKPVKRDDLIELLKLMIEGNKN